MALEATYVHGSGELRETASAAVASGEVLVRGERIGIYSGLNAAETSDEICLVTEGVFEMASLSTDVWADGDVLYWDATNNRLTDTAASHKKAGLAVGAKTSGQTVAKCDINQRQ